MSVPFLDTTDRMVHGHEGWLEAVPNPADQGAKVALSFKWGHNMVSHGLARKENLRMEAVPPNGERQALPIDRNTEDRYLVDVTPETCGLHHFVCENTGHYVITRDGRHRPGTLKEHPDAPTASFYRQFSHTCLWVGGAPAAGPAGPGPILPFRLVPEHWGPWQAGDTLDFSLQKEGLPLADSQVDVAHAAAPGSEVTQTQGCTDLLGRLTITVKEAGQYLLIARHRTNEGKAGVYRDTSLTYTFLFRVR